MKRCQQQGWELQLTLKHAAARALVFGARARARSLRAHRLGCGPAAPPLLGRWMSRWRVPPSAALLCYDFRGAARSVMTSVWKRVQRAGKKASKFEFIATFQELLVECSHKWWVPTLRFRKDSSRKRLQMQTNTEKVHLDPPEGALNPLSDSWCCRRAEAEVNAHVWRTISCSSSMIHDAADIRRLFSPTFNVTVT